MTQCRKCTALTNSRLCRQCELEARHADKQCRRCGATTGPIGVCDDCLNDAGDGQ